MVQITRLSGLIPPLSLVCTHFLPQCFLHRVLIVLFQLEKWLNESVPMHVPQLFVRTRWHSKYLMLLSLFQNKEILVAMFDLAEAGDGTCAALLNHILTEEEWKILEVCLMQCAL